MDIDKFIKDTLQRYEDAILEEHKKDKPRTCNKAELKSFIHDKLTHYQEAIMQEKGELDSYALGEITFYMALRRTLSGKHNKQDLGMLDAINDTLQKQGVIGKNEMFFK